MAQYKEDRPIGEAVELPKTHGFVGLADAVTALLNSAMLEPFRRISIAHVHRQLNDTSVSSAKAPTWFRASAGH